MAMDGEEEVEMEFVADPTDEQAAKIDRGLVEYSADFASTRSPVPVRAVFVESGRVVAGIDGAGYWRKVPRAAAVGASRPPVQGAWGAA